MQGQSIPGVQKKKKPNVGQNKGVTDCTYPFLPKTKFTVH